MGTCILHNFDDGKIRWRCYIILRFALIAGEHLVNYPRTSVDLELIHMRRPCWVLWWTLKLSWDNRSAWLVGVSVDGRCFIPQNLTTDGICRSVGSKNRWAVGKQVSLQHRFGDSCVFRRFWAPCRLCSGSFLGMYACWVQFKWLLASGAHTILPDKIN